MMFPIENNDTFLLFFHGLDSSCETSKYTCIKREPKYCQTVNYRENFAEIFKIYDALIQEKMQEYPRVVLASCAGWLQPVKIAVQTPPHNKALAKRF